MREPDWLKRARAEGRITGEYGVRSLPAAPVPSEPGASYSEAQFTADVIAYARACGWLVAHFRSVRVARADGSTYWQTPVQGDGAGFPDLMLVCGERVIAAELKVGKNATSDEQDKWLAAFRAAGVTACVWRPAYWGAIVQTLEGTA